MGDMVLERWIYGWLFRGTKLEKFPVFARVVELLLGEAKQRIDSNTCPICGEVFPERRALVVHLIPKRRCGKVLEEKVKSVVDVYVCLRRKYCEHRHWLINGKQVSAKEFANRLTLEMLLKACEERWAGT